MNSGAPIEEVHHEHSNDTFRPACAVEQGQVGGTESSARIVHQWFDEIGLDPTAYSTLTMCRTKPTLIYRRAKNLRAVQLLLGHTRIESTVRYLGIEVDDALEMAEQTDA